MPKPSETWKPAAPLLWLALSLALSSCASTGKPASGNCPAPVRMPELPPSRFQAPTYERQTLDVFSESAEVVTPT